MIGAPVPAAPGPAAMPAAAQTADGTDDAGTAPAGSANAGASTPDDATAQRAPARGRRTADRTGWRDDGAVRNEPHGTGTKSRGFADLLAEGGALERAPSAPVPAAKTDSPQADPTTNLPDQLLALLAGELAVPMARPEAPAATPAAANSAKTGAPPLPQIPGAPTFAANASTDAPAAPGVDPGIAKAGEDAFAVLARLADTTAGRESSGPAADANQAQGVLPAAGPGGIHARTGVAPGLPAAPLPMPANPEAGFEDGFGARVAWIAEQRLGQAEIRLNPEHLGPIDVRVQLDGTRVDAEFHSAHAEVRQALEASVPRLRELLGQQGLQLGQADVGQRQAGRDQARSGDAGTTDGKPSVDHAPTAATATTRLRTRRLLDEYA